MWYLEKTVMISSAHHLENYEKKCKANHGHNWKIIVKCKGNNLDKVGMLTDFGDIKEIVDQFDHVDLNKAMINNPTAENLAKLIHDSIVFCYEVFVEETPGSVVRYVKD